MFGFESSVIAEYWPLFVHGAWTTVQVTIICVCLGMCLGTLLGMGRLAQARYNPLKGFLHYCVRWPITVYVSFFRGTPLFVQIFLMYFAVLPVFCTDTIVPSDAISNAPPPASNPTKL